MRVAICICTFRRELLLSKLLDGLSHLAFRKMPSPDLRIVVVDNDESASARKTCDTLHIPWPLTYVVEPKRGISHARNRAIAEAGQVNFIAFIDDDEVPSAQWLDELLWAQAKFAADVVSGPVLPMYDPGVANWIRDGLFFEPAVAATGALRASCATNNALIAIHVFKTVPRFDDAFALSGAEDTDFFLRVRRAGYTIVWSREAIALERISSERGNTAWILRRQYQTGNGWVFCEARLDDGLRARIGRFSKASAHVAIGSVKTMWSILWMDRSAVVRSLQRVCLGAGMLTALAGHRFLAYQKAGLRLHAQRITHIT